MQWLRAWPLEPTGLGPVFSDMCTSCMRIPVTSPLSALVQSVPFSSVAAFTLEVIVIFE